MYDLLIDEEWWALLKYHIKIIIFLFIITSDLQLENFSYFHQSKKIIMNLSPLYIHNGSSLYSSICPCHWIRSSSHYHQYLAWIFCKGIEAIYSICNFGSQNNDFLYQDHHKKYICSILCSLILSKSHWAFSWSSALNMPHTTINLKLLGQNQEDLYQ